VTTSFSDVRPNTHCSTIHFQIVHVVSRWLSSDRASALDRVEHTMAFLFMPTFMAFATSTLGVISLAFTDFDFNTRFFLRPLLITMFVTYFFGCYWLPVFLTWFDFDFMKLGSNHRRLRESCGSPLSKLQGSESSDIPGSTSSELQQGSSDIETNSSIPVSVGDCMKNTIGEAENSLEFLPCYHVADCGGPGLGMSEEDLRGLQLDDNSLISAYNCIAESKTSRDLEEVEQKDSPTRLPLSPTKRDHPATYSSYYEPGMRLPPMKKQRSAPSVQSSQATVEVNNTEKHRVVKEVEPCHQSSELSRPDPGDRSLVDATTESADISTATEDVLPSQSITSNLEAYDDPSTQLEESLASPSSNAETSTREDVRPKTIDRCTSPEMIKDISLGPATTGGLFRTGASPSFFGPSLPALRQSHSVSPRKKLFPISHLKYKSRGSSSSGVDPPSKEALLNYREQVASRVGGYDLGHVLDGATIQTVSHNDPPRSNREIVRGETGEVLSVHAAIEDKNDGGTDTIKL
jgi:hypothetical protein